MRRIASYFAIALVLLTADNSFGATFDFKASNLTFSDNNNGAQYSGLRTVAVGKQFQLSAKTVYVELRPGESAEETSYNVSLSSDLGYVANGYPFGKLATSDSTPYKIIPEVIAGDAALGSVAVYLDVANFPKG